MSLDIFAFLMVIFAALFSGLYSWRWRHIPGVRAFLLASSGIIMWTLGHAFSVLSPDPEQSLFWWRIGTLGVDLLPIAWLAFVLLYTQGKQHLGWLTWAGLLILPITSQLTGTPTQNPAFLQPAIQINVGVTTSWISIQHSLWGWAHLLVGIVILLAGGVMLVLHLAHTPGIMRRSTRWIDVTALVPMAFYLVEIAGVKIPNVFSITPLIFLAGQFAFLWSVRQGAHFQVLPEARDLLLEWMDNGILVLDKEGRVIDANPAAARLFNKSATELLNQPLSDLFPQTVSVLDRSPGQDTIQTEFLFPAREALRWLDLRITPLYKNNLDFSGYMLEMQEVTRRRMAEDALRDSEQRYRQVIDGMIEGVVVQDADGVIIACNPNAELILGVPRGEMLGQKATSRIWRTIHGDGSPLPAEEHPAMVALDTGQRRANETIGLYLPDGSLRWLLINSQPLVKDNENKPYAVVSTFVDITEERNTEQTLRDSENMFRGLLEFAPVAIIIISEIGYIQLMNDRAEQLFGYSRTELQGEKIEKLIPERYQNRHIQLRGNFIRDSRSRPMGQGQEIVAQRKNGSEFPVDIGLNLIHTNHGLLVMSYLIDITDRKQSEEALRQANEQLVNSLVELESHNRELMTLAEMGDMLQICVTIKEAYIIVASFAQRLFPDCSGALYMTKSNNSLFEIAIAWGEQLPEDTTFTADMCWALRGGRTHSTTPSNNPLVCQHADHLPNYDYAGYICVPMGTLGEVFGLFHLRWKALSKQSMIEQLAATVAEHITLSLSNLMLRESLRNQSIRDPLTGVFNRRYMEEAFTHELFRAVRHAHSVGVIMLDVDHFKEINDQFGHASGDNLLKVLANYLKNRLRGEDILCRYGGEEFTIILPNTTLENAILLAEKLQREIKDIELDLGTHPSKPVSLSLGVAAFPEHGQNAEELLKSADWALYQAKQKGRDRVMTAQTMT